MDKLPAVEGVLPHEDSVEELPRVDNMDGVPPQDVSSPTRSRSSADDVPLNDEE